MNQPSMTEPLTAEEEQRARDLLAKDGYHDWSAGWVRRLLASLDAERSRQAADRSGDTGLRQRAAFLADRAAHAVTEPRRFHESADEQHDLSVAIADVRRALGSPEPSPVTEGLDYGWDSPAPGTRLWRLRNHPDTLSREDAVRVAHELDARPSAADERSRLLRAGHVGMLGTTPREPEPRAREGSGSSS